MGERGRRKTHEGIGWWGKTMQPYHPHTHTQTIPKNDQNYRTLALVRVREGRYLLLTSVVWVIWFCYLLLFFSFFLKILKSKKCWLILIFWKKIQNLTTSRLHFPVISKPQRTYSFHERPNKEPSIFGGWFFHSFWLIANNGYYDQNRFSDFMRPVVMKSKDRPHNQQWFGSISDTHTTPVLTIVQTRPRQHYNLCYHPFSFFFCLSILGPGVTLCPVRHNPDLPLLFPFQWKRALYSKHFPTIF